MSSGSIDTTITPRQIAAYFDLEACNAYLNLEKRNDSENQQHRKNADVFKGISPLHNQQGSHFEIEQLKRISKTADEVITDRHRFRTSHVTWPRKDYYRSTQKFTETLRRINSESEDYLLVIDQPKFISGIGVWTVKGISDIILVWSTSSGVHIHVVEMKSSYSNRTAFKIQAATYISILQQKAPSSAFSFDVEYSGVIVSREEGEQLPSAKSPKEISTVDLDALVPTVRNLLADNGAAISSTGQPYRDLPIRLSSRCSRCKFQPICLSNQVRKRGLGLLQLDVGTQNQLANVNKKLNTLPELVELIDWSSVHGSGAKAWSFDDIEFDTSRQSTINEIQQRVDISDLRSLIQRAKAFDDEIKTNPRKGRIINDKTLDPAQIQGSGNGRLPIQDPTILFKNMDDEDDVPDPRYPPDSIVKVHTTVIKDNVRDCILGLAARIDPPGTASAEYIVELPVDISFYDESEQIDRPACEEVQLLVSFTRRLIDCVIRVSPDPTRHGESWSTNYDKDDIFLHFYFYDRFQLTSLIDALRRHSGVGELDTLRSILSLRSALTQESPEDQMVYSIIDAELRERFGMRFLGLGFVQTVEQFCDGGKNGFNWNDVPGYSGPNLTETFRSVFQIASKSMNLYPGLLPDFKKGLQNVDDDAYFTRSVPFINLHETTVPLEYFYALHGKLKDISGGKDKGIIDPDNYRYQTGAHSNKITTPDIKALLKQWTRAISHVESEIGNQAGYNAKIEKSPFKKKDLESFTLHRDELSTTVLEYLLLEDEASDRDLERYYRSPVDERVRSGKSVGGRAEIEIGDGIIRATLLGPDLNAPLSKSTNEFPISISENDWVVLTPLDSNNPPRELKSGGDQMGDRSAIKNSPIGIIKHLDTDTDSLVIDLIGIGFSSDDRCVTWHRNLEYIGDLSIPNLLKRIDKTFTDDGDDDADDDDDEDSNFVLELDDNQRFVLDPMYDNIGGYRASEALEQVRNNDMYHHLATLYQGRIP